MKSAILITYDKKDIIDEAIALCESAGYKVHHIIKQKFLKKPKYGISDMALEHLKNISNQTQPDVIIFDEILKPTQNYNLASKLHKDILDREMLILEIFENRASSSESKLQVKLAQMRYEMSRAKEKVRLSKMGEQPGFMGIGKFEVDVYYNDIKHRMNKVKMKLQKAEKLRKLHREARKRLDFKTISLAGYTSAGKTTLFNKLTGNNLTCSSELFTTLATTTRRIKINHEPFLISDTVGFISKLPAYMIEAFKSTLEELTYADIVVLVIDISDSVFELEKKFKSCIKTLSDLEVDQDKIIYALNKSDLISQDDFIKKIQILGLENNKKTILVSAKTGKNLSKFKELVKRIIDSHQQIKIQPRTLKEELEKIYGN